MRYMLDSRWRTRSEVRGFGRRDAAPVHLGRCAIHRRRRWVDCLHRCGGASASRAAKRRRDPGPGGEPIYEWLEVRPFYGEQPTVTE